MSDKLVFVKELKTGYTKGENPKAYPIIIDQNNEQWHIFKQGVKLEHRKAYLFTFHANEKGFNTIDAIKPVVNLMHEKAIAETADRSTFVKEYGVALSYSKDLVVAGKIDMTDIYLKAQEIYTWIADQSDKEMKNLNQGDKK